MRLLKLTISHAFLWLTCIVFLLTSCLTSAKLDKFVASQYNNELPKAGKKKKADIEVTSPLKSENSKISTTTHKTDKFLPLIVYWKYNHRQSCSLNPSIAVTNFSNAVNNLATKTLTDKLNGRKLELTVEQAPAAFSVILKENMIWLVYAFAWAKVYIEPDKKDLIVAYKLVGGEGDKTGKITVNNTSKNMGLRFFQSWKSATSEYISEYNANFTTMTKNLVTQLTSEL